MGRTYLTKSQESNPHKFHYYQAGAQSVANGWHQLLFDTQVFDTNSDYSTSTHQFTAPVAGFYRFMLCAGVVLASGDLFSVALNKNTFSSNPTLVGTETVQGNQTTTGAGFICALLQLSYGDTVQPYIYNGDASSKSVVTGSNFCWFQGELTYIT